MITREALEKIEERVLHWVMSFVVGLNLCPFAKKVISEQKLSIIVSPVQKQVPALEAVLSAIADLEASAHTETSLVVFPFVLNDFWDYLDFVSAAEALLSREGYEGVYQLASFHPEYCFADTAVDDVSNYTNRSPYPMVHILKEESLDKAIDFYGDTETIPEKNIQLMRQLGLHKIKQLIQ